MSKNSVLLAVALTVALAGLCASAQATAVPYSEILFGATNQDLFQGVPPSIFSRSTSDTQREWIWLCRFEYRNAKGHGHCRQRRSTVHNDSPRRRQLCSH